MAQRLALVTGGTGGIGTEICKGLAAAGHRVISTCVESEREAAVEWQEQLRAEGFDIELLVCDVTDYDSCVSTAERIRRDWGPVEVLVNAAGVTRDTFLHKMESDQWQAVIDTNLTGAFNITRQFIESMRAGGFGRVVNIASVNGQTGQFGQTNYSAAKAGLHGFTMALAKEGARRGVTANTVSPGYVDTPMTAAMPADIRDQVVAQIPAGRMARSEEIARVVLFLVEEDSGYINGANIPVNGALFCSF